jgi:hypothetical protein
VEMTPAMCPFRVSRFEASGLLWGRPALVGLSGPWGSGCACLFAEVVCSSSSSVAGRWPSPLPPRPSGFPGVLEVFRPPPRGGRPPSGPLRPCLPFSALVSSGLVEPAFLSWDSRAPPSTCLRASTPGADPEIGPFGPRLPRRESRSALVVSHHLGGLLRSELAGLLHPAVDPGVRRVSGHRPAAHRRSGPWRAGDLPRDAHTPKNLLVVSRTASPRPLPPCRSLSVRRALPGAVDET